MTSADHNQAPSGPLERNHMNRMGYRYQFAEEIDLREVRKTLLLALLATEGLFGHCRVRGDAECFSDESINVIVIDAGTPVGMAVSLIFTAFIAAEFGATAFSIRRVQLLVPSPAA